MPPDVSVLTDPDGFFRERRTDPSLVWPAAILTAVALLAIAGQVYRSQAISSAMSELGGQVGPGGPGGGGGIGGLFQVLGYAFAAGFVYLRWLLYAAAFHVISMAFDGEGEFTTTLALVGWGFVPYAVGEVVNLAYTVYRFEVGGLSNPSDFGELFRNLGSGPVVALSAALGIVFVLWAAFLWAFAVKHARGVDLPDAAKTVALPALVGIGFATHSVLTALQIL